MTTLHAPSTAHLLGYGRVASAGEYIPAFSSLFMRRIVFFFAALVCPQVSAQSVQVRNG